MSKVMEKARELGEAIANSRELKEMHVAEVAMLQDSEAKKVLEEFQEKQRAFRAIQAAGKKLTETQKKEVSALEEKMLSNPLIYNYLQKQQNFEKILDELNKIIEEAIANSYNACGSSCAAENCNQCSKNGCY